MENEKLLQKMQERLAEISVSGSALRNQGGAGVVSTARYFLKKIDLAEFADSLNTQDRFSKFLDVQTEKLVGDFRKIGAGNWGAARKALNLFFREVVYNRFWAQAFDLPTDFEKFNHAIRFLEIPLDGDVMKGIKHASNLKLRLAKIKDLDKKKSEDFQSAAWQVAQEWQTVRIHLDLIFWRPNAEVFNNI